MDLDMISSQDLGKSLKLHHSQGTHEAFAEFVHLKDAPLSQPPHLRSWSRSILVWSVEHPDLVFIQPTYSSSINQNRVDMTGPRKCRAISSLTIPMEVVSCRCKLLFLIRLSTREFLVEHDES